MTFVHLLRIGFFWRALDFSSWISTLCRSTFFNLFEFGVSFHRIRIKNKKNREITAPSDWSLKSLELMTLASRFSVCVLKIRCWLKNLRYIYIYMPIFFIVRFIKNSTKNVKLILLRRQNVGEVKDRFFLIWRLNVFLQ